MKFLSNYYQEQIDTTSSRYVLINNLENAGFVIHVDSNKIRFALYSASASSYVAVISDETLEVNNWYNVVCTYDGSNMKIYINGIFDKSGGFSESIPISTVTVMLGANSAANEVGTSQFFHGYISDAFLASNVLSETEIANNFTNGFNYTETSSTYFNYNFE